MRITPILTNSVTRNHNVKFSGLYGSDEELERAKAKIDSGAILMGATMAAVMLGAGALLYDKKKPNPEEMCEKIENLYNSKELQKDTFAVKDMTGDETPDLILYKNDGSKVVIDIANQKVLEDGKDLTHDKFNKTENTNPY